MAGGLLAAIPGGSVGGAEIPSDQRQAIEGIIHDYLVKNPDVLIEALRGAKDKLNREADAEATKVLSERANEIFNDPATPITRRGTSTLSSSSTIVVPTARRCSRHCRQC